MTIEFDAHGWAIHPRLPPTSTRWPIGINVPFRLACILVGGAYDPYRTVAVGATDATRLRVAETTPISPIDHAFLDYLIKKALELWTHAT